MKLSGDSLVVSVEEKQSSSRSLFISNIYPHLLKGFRLMRRCIIPLLLLFMAALVIVPGCSKKESGQSEGVALTKETTEHTVAGIEWSYPSRWIKGAVRPMRVATYSVPVAEGDAEGGECALFYFGSGQGGDVNSNIERWGSQFENAAKALKTTMQISGMNVTRVQIAGTYLAPAGPMMESQGKKENYRLLGAIVEAPEGLVFFKFTGPARSIGAAEAEFDVMIGSIAKK